MQFFFLKEEQCASSLAVVTVLKWEGIHRILALLQGLCILHWTALNKQMNEQKPPTFWE